MPKYLKKVDPEDQINKDNKNAERKKLDYNDKTYQSYIENGFVPVPEKLDKWERRFLSRVDLNKSPIRRTVTLIQRLKAPDYNTERHEQKEFLIYREDWLGKDWLGRKIPPVRGHLEGLWYKQLAEPVTDTETHLVTGYERTGEEPIYDIPFSKANVDKIIKGSFASNEESIKFFIEDRGRSDTFTYDQFVNSSWIEITNMLMSPGGAQAAHVKEIMQAAAANPAEAKIQLK